jgi:Flp pilus assembly protein TadG
VERRGAVLPLTAILVVFLFALIALAVDLGWIMAVDTQVQSAADAAALAGAGQLLDQSALQGTQTTGNAANTAMQNANTSAQTFALMNKGGGVSLNLALNEDGSGNVTNSATGDIVCGYLANPSDQSEAMTVTTPGVGPYPNSVQVTVHRDSTRNGSLGLFFAPVLGIRTFDLSAKATATYEGGIRGFKIHAPGTSTCKLLPFALYCCTWSNATTDPWYDSTQPPGLLQQTAASGTYPDNFARSSSGTVTSGADNIFECKIFPISNNGNGNGNGNGIGASGNFGTINIGAMGNGTSDLNRVIINGPNASDLSVYPGGKLQLDPTTGTVILSGNPGVSAGCKDAVTSVIGQARILPLYSTVSGNGANAQYTIVGFVGVTILECVLTGSLSSKHITIQPCWCIDPNAEGGGSGTSTFVVKPLALTR